MSWQQTFAGRGKWIAAGAALALCAAAVMWSRGRTDEPASARNAPPVEKVVRATLAVVAEASGVLEPLRWVEVKSKASGEALEVLAETGDAVEAGALLARIDPRDVENAYQQSLADLEAARVRARTTRANQERILALKATNAVTQQEVEAVVEAAATANASLVRAQTNLTLALERRRDVTIRAPIAGTVIERHVEPGQIIASATSNVSGGTVLFKMADLASMQVRARVDETDIGLVAPGQPVRVTVEAFPGRTFRGEVHKIEPQSVVEQNVTRFPVLVRLTNTDGRLRPGMNAEVSVEIARREDVVAVPNAAVVTLRDAPAAARVLGVSDEALAKVTRGPSAPRAEDAECAELTRASSDAGATALTEEMKAKLAQCTALSRESGGPGAGRGRRQGSGADRGVGSARPAIVFVKGAAGVTPTRVMLGLGDWDRTEVLSGLEEGSEVVLVSVAQLEQRNRELNERIRSRTGGLPGSGGGSGGGQRRGGPGG